MTNITVKVRDRVPVRVRVAPTAPVNAVMRRIQISNARLEELLNVNEDDYGLGGGFIVVYDSVTKTWRTRPVALDEALDGGIY